MRYIGDVHGKFNDYLAIIKDVPKSVQVGDFGIGFVPEPTMDINHRFIRGNHDNPALCKENINWIPDGTIEDGVLYIGGALSIDRHYRVEGVSWWPDEELKYNQWCDIMDNIQHIHTVISHDCPESFAKEELNLYKFSTTSRNLNYIYNEVKPDLWIFGHWHQHIDIVKQRTRFICLNELEYIDI